MRPVQVQPAKSNKSKCKNCHEVIQQGQLRAKMVDDREFREYLRRNPDARDGEGYSRGYFQTETGVISIQKYFVHLNCYQPIRPHPIQRQYFKLISAKGPDKQRFNAFFNEQAQQEQEKPKQKQSKSIQKPKPASKSASKPKRKTK